MKYLPHIDGLRAISILLVILYHLNIAPFTGGFIGVDIFFVISGYLITDIINRKIVKRKFSIFEFYITRAKRLLPPLFFVILLSLIGSLFLFTPFHLESFSQSAISTVFAVSNVFFWLENDYFDISTRLKPLLHTWSLSVEWQFYFFWPLILLLIYKIRHFGVPSIFILVIGALSLYLNILFQYGIAFTLDNESISKLFEDGASTIFYHFPFRMFEFIIGALLTWLPPFKSADKKTALLMFVGLSLVFFSAIFYDQYTLFPSYNALAPTIGAALLIATGHSKYLGGVLRNPVSVYIGQISYSVYLIHWPIIVFAEYVLFRSLTFSESLLVLVVSLISGAVMRKYIELPFYKGGALNKFSKIIQKLALPTFGVVLVLFSLLIWQGNGWKWRINPSSVERVADAGAYHIDQYGGVGFKTNEVIELGQTGVSPSFVFAGDSHAAHYMHGLSEALKENSRNALGLFDHGCFISPNTTVYRNGTEDAVCSGEYEKLKNTLKGNDLSLIIAYSWTGYRNQVGLRSKAAIKFDNASTYQLFLLKEIEELQQDIGLNHPIILIGQVPGVIGHKANGIGSITDCILRPSLISSFCISKFDFPLENALGFEVNKKLETFSNKTNITFINPEDIFCDEHRCKSIINDKFMYSDNRHVSKDGSIYAVHKMEAILQLMIKKVN
ncbi:MAG: hypothetical protein COB24_00025 [Hyphomicrobiales bacterium]|nr:MAG: hypothetical protein COB24_00025 [Hyphomicrobiales bacterium]